MPYDYNDRAKHEYKFSIRGSASLIRNTELGFADDDHRGEKAVLLLNSKKDEIADKINLGIERHLPSSFGGNVKIETSLEFSEGSVAWLGAVIVFDWVGKIVDVVTFVQLTSSAIQFVVNRVISREATQNSIPIEHETIRTHVMPEFTPTNQTDFLVRDLVLRQEEQVRLLRNLSRNFENLLGYIGQLQRKNSAFRLSNYYLVPQRQAFKDNIIIIFLAIIAILQFMNYFGIDTIKGWFATFTNIFP